MLLKILWPAAAQPHETNIKCSHAHTHVAFVTLAGLHEECCVQDRVPCCRYMAVAEPGLEKLAVEDIHIFKVPFGVFIKMHAGTWHAGPHFEGLPHMDFYNLELADTNQVDHFNHYFDQDNGCTIKIAPC